MISSHVSRIFGLIYSYEDLQRAVEQSEIGKPLSLSVQRGEQTEQLSVRPQELENAAR